MTTFDRLDAYLRRVQQRVACHPVPGGWFVSRHAAVSTVVYPSAPTLESAILELLTREAA